MSRRCRTCFLSPVLGEEDVGERKGTYIRSLSLPDPTCASEVILTANLGCRGTRRKTHTFLLLHKVFVAFSLEEGISLLHQTLIFDIYSRYDKGQGLESLRLVQSGTLRDM